MDEFIQAGAAIIGVVNGIRLLQAKDTWGFLLFVAALGASILFGALQWFGLPGIEAGVAVALGSSGVYQVAKKIGGQ